ncbi:hypothetical protein ACRRTK_004508 [Alexandromys fortis]
MGWSSVVLLVSVLTLWLSIAKGEEMTCSPPSIENGDYTPYRIKHRAGDEIKYTCKDGFSPATRKTVVQCTSTGWIPAPRCIMTPCDFPQINNGGLVNEERFRPYFPVPIGKQFIYHCNREFVTPSGTNWDYIRCTVQGWEPAVPCRKICSKADIEIENGFLSEIHYIYSLNKTTQYRCKPGYVTSNGEISGSITCLHNGWSSQPSCIKSCDRPIFENAGTENNSTLFKLNDKLDYECHVDYVNKHKRTKDFIICNDDGWSDIPSCYDSTKTCRPPPPIDNGDITSFPLPVYAPLSSVEYQCQSFYQLQGKKKITCRNGEWSEKPKCLHPCIVSEEIMEKHNIIFRWKEKQKRYYKSGEMQEFKCKNGYHLATSQLFQTFCIDGHINYPTCTKSH